MLPIIIAIFLKMALGVSFLSLDIQQQTPSGDFRKG
jgi:hypothetical protein